MKRYLPSKEDPPDTVDALVGVVFIAVGWFAAVGIQSYAESLRWERAEELMRMGLDPHGKGPAYLPLFALSMVVGFAIPMLAVAANRWLRRSRGLRPGGRARSEAPLRQVHAENAAPKPEIDVEARTAGSLTCPYCKSECGEADDLVRCSSCAAQQHSQCLAEHGRCAVCGRGDGFEPVRA